jgi:hypothetical protein
MRRLILTGRISATLVIAIAFAGGALSVIEAIAPPAAYAGTWADVTCTQPLAGLPQAPTEGWVGADGGGTATQGCDPYTGGLVASISDATSFTAGSGASWRYTAPAGSTIAGGQVVAQIYAPQGIAYISTGSLSAAMASCQGGSPCGGVVGGSTGVVTLPIAPVGGTTISEVAECAAPSNGDCPAGQGGSGLDAQVNLYQAVVDLTNNATPAASNFGGGLLATGPISGTQPITLTATDVNGSGVIGVTVAVDGLTLSPAGTPDTNSGHCVSIGRDAGGFPEFLYAQPCKQSIDYSAEIPTAGLSDGTHTLTVTVTDAAGNSSVVMSQPLVTQNRTVVSANLNSSVPPPPAPAPTPGASTSTTPSLPCNAACDPHAILQAGYATAAAKTPTDTYGHSEMTLNGRLLDHTGAPMPGAQVELRQQPAAAGATSSLVATATTTATGGWSFNVPRGPSRLLVVGYRAHLGDAAFATQLQSHQVVVADAKIKAPKRTQPGKRIVFTGTLAGGNIPPGGELVAMEIDYAHKWRTIDLVRANQKGSFSYAYVFAGVPAARYRFRAVVPASPAYPFARGVSHPVSIEVN